MILIILILIISLIDLTVALNCWEVPIKECLDYCKCFKCVMHQDNTTIEECHSQKNSLYDFCQSHHEVVESYERRCLNLPLSTDNIILITAISVMMGLPIFGALLYHVLRRKWICTCMPSNSNPIDP